MASFDPSAPVDLEPLDAYLRSGRGPAECMGLSELDGFLAGIAAGPVAIPWEEARAEIWGDDMPDFANADEQAAVNGLILARYAEIVAALAQDPTRYAPVFLEDIAGTLIVEDWALGFMQAVALRQEQWKPVLADAEHGMLLIPIAVLAGLAEPDTRLDVELPDGFEDSLLENADAVLPGCVRGLYAYWRQTQ
jgi:uncharacterized protein